MIARYGIYFTFDAHAEQLLQTLREKLAKEVDKVPKVASKMGPHLTLLVFADADYPSVQEKFEHIADGMRAYSIALDDIGVFLGKRNVLYIKPLLSDDLQASYLHCFHHFSTSGIVSHYHNPENWHPHVTLTKNIDARTLQQVKSIA